MEIANQMVSSSVLIIRSILWSCWPGPTVTTLTPMAFMSPNNTVIPHPSLSLVSWVTQTILVARVEQVSVPVLRQSIRRMFGTLSSKKIRVTQLTSDNEGGMKALFGDMNAMGVKVVTVAPSQHGLTIERMIRTLKETILSAIFSLPYLLPDAMIPQLIMSSAKKLLLFQSSSPRCGRFLRP